jgi:hypothetical protein
VLARCPAPGLAPGAHDRPSRQDGH